MIALAAGLCLAAASIVTAQPAPAAGQPPIVDRELYFGDPEISGAQLSPDGRFIAFLKPFKGTRNVWVKTAAEPFEKARPITADTKRPIGSFFWSRDSRAVLYVQDQGGDENYNVYAVDPAAAPAAGAEVPAARNLTAAKGVRAFIYAVPKSEPDAIYVGLNDREAAWHDLYKVRISTGERQLLRKNTERLTGWVFDTKDQLRLATRSAENGDTEVLRIDPSAFTKIYACSVFETCSPVQFHKDGTRVYMVSNKGEGVDLMRLTLVDVATGAETVVETDPQKRVDIDSAIFSEKTDELVATVYVDDRRRLYFKDPVFEADYRFVEKQLPGRELNFRSPTADEQRWIVSAASDLEPGEAYLYDRATKTLTRQYRVYEKLPRATLAPMTSVRYPSSDGLEIPAYLTLPKGVAPKGLPAIVVPHGGPWARDTWGYDAFAQFLANRGYAVLQPNFRASTGYGRRFLDAGNRQWGEKMQDDLTWGVKYLVAKGIADPKRIGILGGSYGGYATLAGVAFTPDVYAAGVSLVGPSNLITLLDSIPAVLGGRPQDLLRAHGGPVDAFRQGSARAAVAAELGREDQDAAARHPGRERPQGEQGGVGPDRHRAARSRVPGGVHRGAGRGARLRAPREQHGRLRRRGALPGHASQGTLPGRRHPGGRGPAQGDHGRPEDGGAAEEDRCRVDRDADARIGPCSRVVVLCPEDRHGRAGDGPRLDRVGG